MTGKNKTLGIIPARYASTRFPGKPLANLNGKPMVQWVYECARRCPALDALVVATEDERIRRAVERFGGAAVMTSAAHLSGTDRCAEVAALPEYSDCDVVVNIQGDEPGMEPELIEVAVHLLRSDPQWQITTLATPLRQSPQLFDPNVVKVLLTAQRRAMYFSRTPLPHQAPANPDAWIEKADYYRHIGLYTFRRDTLLAVARLPAGQWETAESLEQLRWIENGFSIGAAIVEHQPMSVDTPDDLLRPTGRLVNGLFLPAHHFDASKDHPLKKIIIAIDGHSSCGKSTLAKSLSEALGYTYISTGDMYRAITLYFLSNDVDADDLQQVRLALPDIKLHFERHRGQNRIFLNGEDVAAEIRSMEVADRVSKVAAIGEVRRKLVQQQRAMGRGKGVVMEGRDIGTVVFPDAELKIFLTADIEVRAQRRYKELLEMGKAVVYEGVLDNLHNRDRLDSTRADSPLCKADDARVLDNTSLSMTETLEKALEMAHAVAGA